MKIFCVRYFIGDNYLIPYHTHVRANTAEEAYYQVKNAKYGQSKDKMNIVCTYEVTLDQVTCGL